MSRWIFILAIGLALPAVGAQQPPPEVGIVERLDERIPIEELDFIDENGENLVLADLFDRPVILTLVYYRCAGICTPLLQELARVADISKQDPGTDYRIVSISFDPGESPDLARVKKENMLKLLKKKQVPSDGWRFLTGSKEAIDTITEAAGFHYIPDRNQVDFVHAGALIFLTTDGKIVRYLNGTRFNPADIELAVIDATEGRARSFMQRMQAFCYNYDPEGRSYVLQINRLILGVTLLFVVLFGVFLLTRNVRRTARDSGSTGTIS